MTKAPPRLTKIQRKALEFIRTAIESSGTSPTLRELCAFMGYSAIGSAQDLVAALRKKGFLQTPNKQSARSLVLTPKAVALHEPSHQSTETTFVIHCLETITDQGNPLEMVGEKTGTLRMSVGMFNRPYPSPKTLYAIRSNNDSMVDAGILEGDWLVVNYQKEVEPGQLVVTKNNNEVLARRLMKDRNGSYLKAENTAYPIIRPKENEHLNILGQIVAVQRIY